MNETSTYGFATRAIHAGQAPDPLTGAVTVPIYQTSTFAQFTLDGTQAYDYARSGNPTRTALETALAALEDAPHALAFASGLAAESAVLLALSAGDHVVSGDNIYGGTYRLFTKVFARHGLTFDFVDTSDLAQVAAALRPETKLIWLETPTNPLLKLADLAAIAKLAKARGILTVVDNTFASPYFQRPLDFGIDLTVYSTTKYHAGHSDVISGAIVTANAELYERLKFLQNAVGGVPGPLDAWLVLRGIKTLALRMRAHAENALAVANFLADHPAVEQVYYPGLPTHPQHALARAQMRGFGGMVSFTLKGGAEAARVVVRRTQLFTFAVSLGGVESLIELPVTMSHGGAIGSPQAAPANLIRLSVGVEEPEDLLADLEQALNQLA
ncbi:MAG: cystathionine gamma-synthase [Caldilineaceae bacterium]|nr:cystathionine gamma-synthase [Caldilineaceae bacterium]